jgi:hypothetical protein
MTETAEPIDVSTTWFSTYGLLTSQRILERLNVRLSTHELRDSIKNQNSVYFQLLRIPLKHIFNGIVLEQANDYQIYAQKILIDYLMSGEANDNGGEVKPGSGSRDALENARLNLMEQSEQYSKYSFKHRELIAESQQQLIDLSTRLNQSLNAVIHKIQMFLKKQQMDVDASLIQQGLRSLMIHYDQIDDHVLASNSLFWQSFAQTMNIKLQPAWIPEIAASISQLEDPRNNIDELLSPYLARTEEMGAVFRSYRRQFMDIVIQVMELLRLLPDYRINEVKDTKNRESIQFDIKIGGE